MKLHVVTGMPRSGSTLLCNVLNQNPRIYASSTSPLAAAIGALGGGFSSQAEVQSAFIRDATDTTGRTHCAMRGVIEGWYHDCAEYDVVFDKGRPWTTNSEKLAAIYPDSMLIVMVRDLRAIFGSMEKQRAKNPVLGEPPGETQFLRAERALAPNGIIGSCAVGIEDVLRRSRNLDIIVDYEQFVSEPGSVIEKLYASGGIDHFSHDFANVEDVSEDVDGVYWDRFPHQGDGKIESRDPDEWKKYVAPDIAKALFNRWPLYNQRLFYRE